MADEINRASPRTQSALLQAMQERKVSIAGRDHDLPAPFHVLATQNPLEQEGTYPLPEAQLDRFLMQVDIGYPDREAERTMLLSTTGTNEFVPAALLNGAELLRYQALVRQLPVGEKIVEAILTLVRHGRPEESPISDVKRYVSWGPGPPRQPGPDAGVPGACLARWPPVTLDRRCRGLGRAGAEASHGIGLCRTCRRHDHGSHRAKARFRSCLSNRRSQSHRRSGLACQRC